MATKLEKIQKIKLPKEITKIQTTKPSSFNQTIIINNPNININYLNDNQKLNGPLSSRGLDNWNLNNNLKEFSETRQLGFFKGKGNRQSRIKSNSPYIIHKVKTQDLKNVNKIYGSKVMKETFSNFHKNQTFNQLSTLEHERMQINQPSIINKILGKPDKTITERFYNANLRKNPKLQRNFQTLPTNHLNSYINMQNPQMGGPKSFRKNKFQMAVQNIPSLTERFQSNKEDYQIQSKLEDQAQDKQDHDSLGIQHYSKSNLKRQSPKVVIPESRRRMFNKTIQHINRKLLNQTDTYFNRSFNEIISQPEIQLFVNSLNNPEQSSKRKEEVVQRQYNQWIDYDFHFDEEKKKINSPLKAKRRNLYEQA